jgi:SAM-dependent methyltransferase
MASSDRRLDAPAFHRNQAAIANELQRLLGDKTGNVLEIGSGTGQHVVAFAVTLSHLVWWPSDPDPQHRGSIKAWQASSALENVRLPVDLDAAALDWQLGRDGRPPANEIAAILAINLLHIAPWSVAEGLLAAAKRYLDKDGVLIIYGPFARNGAHTASSNAAFDAYLLRQNAEWGVRDTADLEALAAMNGLELAEIIDMPTNNVMLVLEHSMT